MDAKNDGAGPAVGGGVALYLYNTNRDISLNTTLETSMEADRSVADLLSTDVRSNKDFSLDVEFTTLPIELEQACRSAVIITLSKGCVYSGCGNVLKLKASTPGDAEHSVYFCLVRDMTPPKEASKGGCGDHDTSYYASDHVVCFVADPSKQSDELELFRPELDAFCAQLARDGVLATFDATSAVSRQRLMSWSRRAVEYLPWCVSALKDHLPEAVHGALLGQTFNVVGGEPEQADDLRRFVAEVSPRALLHLPADSLRPLLDAECAAFVAPLPPATLTLVDGVVAEAKGLVATTSAFCHRWANAMLAAKWDTTALKMIVQNNGRKVIQEVNRIKWLLGMAEANHYALYNAQKYLAKCSTPPRALLQHVVDTTEVGATQHAFDVVSVLIQYQRASHASGGGDFAT